MKKYEIEVKSIEMFDKDTGEAIETMKKVDYYDENKSNFKYSKDKIDKLKNTFDIEKVGMKGFYNDLLKLKKEIEKLYDEHVFYLGYSLSDAPYHGWGGSDELKNMNKVDREICKRFMEIYTILLLATDGEIE